MARSLEAARDKTGRSNRGAVKNEKRLDAFTQAATNRGTADWGACMPEHVHAVIIAATAAGGAITFGLSRDGGAFMLTLLLDGERATLWFNGDADMQAELAVVYEKLDVLRL